MIREKGFFCPQFPFPPPPPFSPLKLPFYVTVVKEEMEADWDWFPGQAWAEAAAPAEQLDVQEVGD